MIKGGDVHCQELSSWAGDDTVEDDFGYKHVSSWSCNLSGVVDSVASNGQASLVGFCFFQSNDADKLATGYVSLAVGRDG